MKNQGIRILDKEDRVVSAQLSDILDEIQNGTTFHWCILFLDGTPQAEEGEFLTEIQKQISESENGLMISWKDLKLLSAKFFQMFEIIALGCKDKTLLHNYEDEVEMYKTCDIAIQMIDYAYWEVFSNDPELIIKLGKKFREVAFLQPDFKR